MRYEKLYDDVALEEKRMIVNLSVQFGTDDEMLREWVIKTLRNAADRSELPIEIDSVVVA